jgi:pyrroloquinoline-quinone synthase
MVMMVYPFKPGAFMSLLRQIQAIIQANHMLQHSFYRDWMEGKLSVPQLENYAMQYTPFVDAFPRFVSAAHSLCESATAREMLMDNLMDEEGKTHSEAHPKLWRNFHASLAGDARDHEHPHYSFELRDTFMNLCKSSFEEAIVTLYAYESQIPEISTAKIEGLKKNYGITEEKALAFFKVHEKADVYHSQACEKIIAFIAPEHEEEVLAAAETSTKSLWNFLTAVHQ